MPSTVNSAVARFRKTPQTGSMLFFSRSCAATSSDKRESSLIKSQDSQQCLLPAMLACLLVCLTTSGTQCHHNSFGGSMITVR